MRRGKVPSVAHMNMHGHRGGCGNAYGFTGAQDVVTHSMAHPHTTHTHTPRPPTHSHTKHSIQSVRSRHRQRQTQTLRHKFIRVSAPFLFDLHTETYTHAHLCRHTYSLMGTSLRHSGATHSVGY